jgi:hypothetical protein
MELLRNVGVDRGHQDHHALLRQLHIQQEDADPRRISIFGGLKLSFETLKISSIKIVWSCF